MSEWNKCKLGDLCVDIAYGYTASATNIPSGPRFLRITDIVGVLNWETVPYCEIDQKNANKYKLEIGDIVIARTGATTGTTAIIKENVSSVFASYLIRFKIDKKKANPFFIGHVLTSTYWKEYVGSIIGGSAQPGANAKQFANFEFNLPDLSIQTRIASILSSLDDKIELNRRTNKTLEELALTLLKDMCVPKGDDLPDGWKVGKVGNLLNHSTESKNPSLFPDVDFLHYSLPAYDEGRKPSLEKGQAILSNKYKVKSFSILVSKLNPRIPRTWAILEVDEENSICSTEFQLFIPKEKAYHSFCYFLFLQTTVIDKMKASATGTSGSHQRIRPQDILDIPIVIPDNQTLKNYCKVTSDFLTKIQSNLDEIETLSTIRDSLLPKLMKGEIEV